MPTVAAVCFALVGLAVLSPLAAQSRGRVATAVDEFLTTCGRSRVSVGGVEFARNK